MLDRVPQHFAMRRFGLIVCMLLAAPSAALAEACVLPDAATVAAQRDPLFDKLLAAPDEQRGNAQARVIWDIWHIAPDPKSQNLLNLGKRKLRAAEYAGAQETLTDLIEYCPEYAEGWNQRAFAKFLAGDLDGSLEDLERTLQLEPRHFAALAGKGLTLLRQGRTLLAHQAIRQAVALHPWLSERHLLPPDQKI
jgi:tetratricopeptide (TPR) repeat protein